MSDTARSILTPQNIWAQLAVSACVLLLPPIAVGAAVVAMRPATEANGARNTSASMVQIPPDAPAGKPFRFVLASAHQESVEKDMGRVTAATMAAPETSGEGRNQSTPATARAAASQVAVAEPPSTPSPEAAARATPGGAVAATEIHPTPHLRLLHHRHRAGLPSARAEARAAQRKAEPQRAPSLRDFLQRLGGQPRNAQKS